MAAEFVGKWKNVRDENFGDYLKALGVGTIKRAVIEKVHPDMVIAINGEEWHIKTTSTFNTQENTFKLGEPFQTDYKGVTTGKMRAVASVTSDGKLVVEATPIDSDLKATVSTREVIGSQMIQTMTCGDVTCKRFYERK